jgi:hypothetical protein
LQDFSDGQEPVVGVGEEGRIGEVKLNQQRVTMAEGRTNKDYISNESHQH